MVVQMLSFQLEKTDKIASYLSGFRKRKYDRPSCTIRDIKRKAQANKESVIAVYWGFFGTEKAHDMM